MVFFYSNIKLFFSLIIIFKGSTLNQLFNRALGKHSISQALNNYSYSVYFAKGNDPRLLNIHQQIEISNFVSKDNLSSSILVYNPIEASRKIAAWKKALPWIKPHYAIKSSPSMDLIKDLANQGAGMDCASKAEIQSSLDAGVTLANIVYSNPIKN